MLKHSLKIQSIYLSLSKPNQLKWIIDLIVSMSFYRHVLRQVNTQMSLLSVKPKTQCNILFCRVNAIHKVPA